MEKKVVILTRVEKGDEILVDIFSSIKSAMDFIQSEYDIHGKGEMYPSGGQSFMGHDAKVTAYVESDSSSYFIYELES